MLSISPKDAFKSSMMKDVFKAGANIRFGRNMGTVHVRPYVGEVTGELRGIWGDACLVAAGIQILMNL